MSSFLLTKFPAIVPLVKNKKAPARFKAKDELYLLSTKLHCGLCESFMVGENGTSSTGKFYQYYKCVSAKNHKGCKKKSVKKTWIEDIVVNTTMEMILDDTVVEYIADLVMEMQSRESMDLPRFKEQLNETEKAISNMLNAIQQCIFNKSTKERLDELEAVKSDLEVKIIQEEMHRPMLKREHITFWIHRFRKLDITKPEQQQRLIDSFVNAIHIFDDKLVITFNYKKACKTVSLCDIIDTVNQAAPRSDLCAVDAPPKLRATQYGRLLLYSKVCESRLFSYQKTSKTHLFQLIKNPLLTFARKHAILLNTFKNQLLCFAIN